MITLEGNSLVFRFPEVHQDAVLYLSFQRTLRVPDDGRTYPLPAGLGSFPLRHVDDFSNMLPSHTSERGGVLMPMWQAEAMWISFSTSYPFAIKIATGKVNAVTGKPWTESLGCNPQDYVVTPGQPWLDGYCVENGIVRQFVAMPLGDGQTVEEQLTQRADHGGLQILVYPIKPEFYRPHRFVGLCEDSQSFSSKLNLEMGVAAGGTIRQDIYDDTYGLDAWHAASSRLFVTLLNAEHWKNVTGELPLTEPVTANEYSKAGLPWFDWYAADQKVLEGSPQLTQLKKIAGLVKKDKQECSHLKAIEVVSVGPQVRTVREFTHLKSGRANDY